MFKDFQTKKQRLGKSVLRKNKIYLYLTAPSTFKLTVL